jgi:biotin synthase-related radical SAM superfamily protein
VTQRTLLYQTNKTIVDTEGEEHQVMERDCSHFAFSKALSSMPSKGLLMRVQNPFRKYDRRAGYS